MDLGQEHGQKSEHGYGRIFTGCALVPMIPAEARDESGVTASRDREHFILWEVEEWSDRPLTADPPRDPFLLRSPSRGRLRSAGSLGPDAARAAGDGGTA